MVTGPGEGGEAVEIVNYHVTCVAAVPQAPIVSPFATAGDRDAAKIGERSTYPGGVRTSSSLYDRTQLPPGAEIAGPAILLQADTTVLVLADQTASVVDLGQIEIRYAAQRAIETPAPFSLTHALGSKR